jgi:hypothetical protein
MLSLNAVLPCSLLAAGQPQILFLVSTMSLSCANERRPTAVYMEDAKGNGQVSQQTGRGCRSPDPERSHVIWTGCEPMIGDPGVRVWDASTGVSISGGGVDVEVVVK